jgi:hypothetical protein
MSRASCRSRATTTAAALLTLVVASLGIVSAAEPAQASIDVPQIVNLNNSLTQSGHVFRNNTASTCAAAKAYPGTAAAGSTFDYAQATYVAQNTGCLTVTRTLADCGGDGPDSANVFVTLYDGTYNPANQAQNYLGDQGLSTNASAMAVNVVEGHSYQVVLTNGNSQAACTAVVTLSIEPNTLILGRSRLQRSTDVIHLVGLGGSQFECKMDQGSFSACSSSLTLWGSLKSGKHTLQARARDGAGVVDPSPASLTFKRCDLLALNARVAKVKTKVHDAWHALKRAKASGDKARIAHARKVLAAALKTFKAAKRLRHDCAS